MFFVSIWIQKLSKFHGTNMYNLGICTTELCMIERSVLSTYKSQGKSREISIFSICRCWFELILSIWGPVRPYSLFLSKAHELPSSMGTVLANLETVKMAEIGQDFLRLNQFHLDEFTTNIVTCVTGRLNATRFEAIQRESRGATKKVVYLSKHMYTACSYMSTFVIFCEWHGYIKISVQDKVIATQIPWVIVSQSMDTKHLFRYIWDKSCPHLLLQQKKNL